MRGGFSVHCEIKQGLPCIQLWRYVNDSVWQVLRPRGLRRPNPASPPRFRIGWFWLSKCLIFSDSCSKVSAVQSPKGKILGSEQSRKTGGFVIMTSLGDNLSPPPHPHHPTPGGGAWAGELCLHSSWSHSVRLHRLLSRQTRAATQRGERSAIEVSYLLHMPGLLWKKQPTSVLCIIRRFEAWQSQTSRSEAVNGSFKGYLPTFPERVKEPLIICFSAIPPQWIDRMASCKDFPHSVWDTSLPASYILNSFVYFWVRRTRVVQRQSFFTHPTPNFPGIWFITFIFFTDNIIGECLVERCNHFSFSEIWVLQVERASFIYTNYSFFFLTFKMSSYGWSQWISSYPFGKIRHFSIENERPR